MLKPIIGSSLTSRRDVNGLLG